MAERTYDKLLSIKTVGINETPFKLINKIRLPKANDSREKFLIYRLREEDIDNIGE